MIPATLKLTLPDTNDATALEEWDLSGLEGWTMVFDLGYYAHAHFKRLLEARVNFVTRLKAQASYEVTESKALPKKEGATTTPEGDVIVSDEIISLGSPKNSRGAVLKGMRLVTSKNRKGQIHTLITNRHDLTALEVVRLYRKRWQIELFFRWLKRQLGTLHALGKSRKAVWLTILVAAIVVVMAKLAEALRPKGLTRVSWLRGLCQSLFAQLRFSG